MAKKNLDTTRRRSISDTARSTAGDDEARRQPTHGVIAEAAYHRYLNRGGGHGRDLDDWFEAERELRDRQASQ